jgi:hypothetical protein
MNACYVLVTNGQVSTKFTNFVFCFLSAASQFCNKCHKTVISCGQMCWVLEITGWGSKGSNYLPLNAHSSKSPLNAVASTYPHESVSGLTCLQKQTRCRSSSLNMYITHDDNLNLLAIQVRG